MSPRFSLSLGFKSLQHTLGLLIDIGGNFLKTLFHKLSKDDLDKNVRTCPKFAKNYKLIKPILTFLCKSQC